MTKLHPIRLDREPYEASLDYNGNSYHLIFGRQINGWFLCIPDHQTGAELAHPTDCLWNEESLEHAGMTSEEAAVISKAMKVLADYI